MTSVIVWPAPGPDGELALWACSDSRVSSSDQPLLNEAAKLLPVTLRCFHQFQDYYLRHELGFAFGGSSLIALNGYITLNNVCSSLFGINESAVPSIADIAVECSRILSNLIRSYHRNQRGAIAPVEAALFGFCPVEETLRLFHFPPNTADDGLPCVGYAECDLSSDYKVLVMGSYRDDVARKIGEIRAGVAEHGSAWHDAPRAAVQAFIGDDDFEAVGGHLQTALANKRGAVIFSSRPPSGQSIVPSAYLSRSGGPRIGPCFAALPLLLESSDS